MILEIEKPRPSTLPSLDYNEGKVLHGVAELVGYANMEDVTREGIYALFGRYERGACYPTLERSFHASVNPSEADDCSEDQVLSFISGLMETLGYGQQPYLVYRHFDIEREHYHVVSVRIKKDGRKINNYYEKRRATAYMREVAPRFGFTMAEKGERVKVSEDISEEERIKSSFRFDPRKGVTAQMRALYARALRYDFESFPQLSCILEDFGLNASLEQTDEGPQVSLQGLDRKGAPVTEAFHEWDLGERLHEEYRKALERNQETHHRRYREKERVQGLVRFAYEISRSEGHFVNILQNKGIHVHFSRTRESGDIFGVTFVDHSTRSVFKASELRDVISVRMLQEAVASGHWRPEDRGRARGTYVRSSRIAAREDAIRLRDLHAGVVARVLKPIGQPTGASWSGRVAPSKEQLRDKWEAEKTGSMYASFEDRRYEEKLT